MSAIRLARGFTGRSLVVKFAGHYHGHVDSPPGQRRVGRRHPRPARLGRRAARRWPPRPSSSPTTTSRRWRPCSRPAASEIACLITEAAAGNMGVVPPRSRVHRGAAPGHRRARRAAGLRRGDDRLPGQPGRLVGPRGRRRHPRPDDLRQGHGRRLPRRGLRRTRRRHGAARPRRPVYQAGTLSGNPVATAAGLATLRACDDALYARLGEVSRAIADAASAALSDAGVPHRIQWAGSMFSVFFRDGEVRTYDDARDQDTAAFGRFFHAMLGCRRLPAAERVRVVVRLRGARRRRRRAGRRGPAGGRAGRCRGRRRDACLSTQPGLRQSPHDDLARPGAPAPGDPQRTVVHLLRHGEVHNPHRLLYGRMPGYHLSGLGRRMADLAAEHLGDHDITHLVSSPLERARETAAPIADAHGLEVAPRRAGHRGRATSSRGCRSPAAPGILQHPRLYPKMLNPFRPSWGEPYVEIVERMRPAIVDARTAARGHEAVIVSHQAPIWMIRLATEGRPLWHNPARRECSLASLTSLHLPRRRAALAQLQRAGGRRCSTRPSPGRAHDGSTHRAVGRGAWSAAALLLGAAACSAGPELGRGAGQGRRPEGLRLGRRRRRDHPRGRPRRARRR